ncbi:hypothetical protein T4D_6095 [Trichinella pseudospiralis]|uniref:Uncharacterized protein n=1 Tax=Trichinella pseudospiralis TaxID=6337 RepID=A0A0V1FHZ8_TRIPS|nr:hypothetical protein T4D_6095 [Trichinella pseudospiralis]
MDKLALSFADWWSAAGQATTSSLMAIISDQECFSAAVPAGRLWSFSFIRTDDKSNFILISRGNHTLQTTDKSYRQKRHWTMATPMAHHATLPIIITTNIPYSKIFEKYKKQQQQQQQQQISHLPHNN